MAIAGEKATYETFLTFTNQLVLLGRNSFHVLMIRTWNERIDYLVKANNFLDCLGTSMSIYPKFILIYASFIQIMFDKNWIHWE